MGAHRAIVLAAMSTLCSSGMATAQENARVLTRVRGADAEMRRLISEADAASPTFRRLVDELQQSNAIVMVQFGLCASGRFRSCVSSIEGDAQRRHVRVLLNTRASDDRLKATIAHELQHAIEMIREPNVVDPTSAMALYRRIGNGECREGLSSECETDQALVTEAQVLAELHRASQGRNARP